MKDQSTIEKMLESSTKEMKKNPDKTKIAEHAVLKKLSDLVCVGKRDAKYGEWTNEDVDFINTIQLLTSKPVIYLCNMSISEYCRNDNRWIKGIEDWIQKHHPKSLLIPFSSTLETQILEMTKVEKEEFLRELATKYGKTGIVSALPSIIVQGYSAIQLIRCMCHT